MRKPLIPWSMAPDLSAAEPFDVRSLEAEIAGIVQSRETGPEQFAPQQLPPYVEHAEGVSYVGRVTGQAVIAQHEELAKSIEAMREPLRQWVEEHEQAIANLFTAIDEIDVTAKRVRDSGAESFRRLQKSSVDLDETRRICGEISAKMGDQP